jgi:hypothetical protein
MRCKVKFPSELLVDQVRRVCNSPDDDFCIKTFMIRPHLREGKGAFEC